jgi:hypothetical protein
MQCPSFTGLPFKRVITCLHSTHSPPVLPSFSAPSETLARGVLTDASYLHRERPTPIACRNEGLLALLLSGLIDGGPFRDEVVERVARGIEMQLSLRQRADGAVVQSPMNDRVRIDYIQHHLMRLLMWYRYQADESWSPPRHQSTMPKNRP